MLHREDTLGSILCDVMPKCVMPKCVMPTCAMRCNQPFTYKVPRVIQNSHKTGSHTRRYHHFVSQGNVMYNCEPGLSQFCSVDLYKATYILHSSLVPVHSKDIEWVLSTISKSL